MESIHHVHKNVFAQPIHKHSFASYSTNYQKTRVKRPVILQPMRPRLSAETDAHTRRGHTTQTTNTQTETHRDGQDTERQKRHGKTEKTRTRHGRLTTDAQLETDGTCCHQCSILHASARQRCLLSDIEPVVTKNIKISMRFAIFIQSL